MRKCIGLIFISSIILLPLKIKAICSVDDKMRYNSLASNITTSYDYVENNDSVTFSVTIHNVHRDLVIVDRSTNRRYQSNNGGLNNFTISGLKDGSNYSFDVYAKSGDCSSRLFNTLYINLPKYNKYYKAQVCEEASDYLPCQKWAEIGDLTYEEFKNNVENYKNTQVISGDDFKSEEKNWLYVISDFWAKYYIYISGIIIVVASITIVIVKKKNKYEF